MRHRKAHGILKRSTDQRKALLTGLVKNLITYQRIQTTHPRAKETQKLADQLITLGKDDSVYSRRKAFAILNDRTMTKRLFDELAPLFKERKGGYTRVLHMSARKGDAAPMALLEFVEKTDEYTKKLERRIELSKKKASEVEAALDNESKEKAPEKKSKVKKKDSEPSSVMIEDKKEQSTTIDKSDSDKKKKEDKDGKENFVGNLKKFFKRKGKE